MKYEFKKNKDFYIVIGSLIVAILTIISNVLINWFNNSYQLNVKKYELTYLEKRKNYTELINVYNSINDGFISIILHFDDENERERLSHWIILDSLMNLQGHNTDKIKELTDHTKNIDSMCNVLFQKIQEFRGVTINIEPFLNNTDRILLRNNTIQYTTNMSKLASIFSNKNSNLKIRNLFMSRLLKFKYRKIDIDTLLIATKDTISSPKYAGQYFDEYLTNNVSNYFIIELFDKLFNN